MTDIMANCSKALFSKIIIAFGLCLLLSTILIQYYFRNLSPDAVDSEKFLHEMPVDKIQEFRIEPYAVSSLTDHTIVLKDRRQIEQLADALRTARPFAPIHPNSRWIAVVRIEVADREYHGEIHCTDNGQGVLFYYFGVGGVWNFGEYRQDTLGPLLEKLKNP